MGGKKMTHVFSDFVANSMISQLEGCLSGFLLRELQTQNYKLKAKHKRNCLSINIFYLRKILPFNYNAAVYTFKKAQN